MAQKYKETLAKWIITRADELDSDRAGHKALWGDVATYCLPRRKDVWTKDNKGDSVTMELFDTTGVQCVVQLAAVCSGWLTPANSPWLRLYPKDKEFRDNPDVRDWLDKVQDEIYTQLRDCKFYGRVNELWQDDVALGTGIFFIEEGKKSPLKFSTRHIRECMIAENSDGEIDTLIRKFDLTARQAAEMFKKSRLSAGLKKDLEDKPDTEYEFFHAIMPNTERIPGKKNRTNKPWRSIYVESKAGSVVHEGGYDTKPFLVVRWAKRSHEAYGFGQATNALPDIKLLNAIMETVIESAQKITDPPTFWPSDSCMGPLDTNPGGYNTFDPTAGEKPFTMPTGDPTIAVELIDHLQEQIRRNFFVDQLKLPEIDRMTATEIIERRDEKLGQLAPILARMENEFLQPLVVRILDLLKKQKKLPEAPAEFEGKEIATSFISLMARAQKLAEAQSIIATVNMITPLVGVKPEVLDIYDFDKIVRLINDINLMPPGLEFDEDQVQKIRADREAKEEAARQAAQAKAEAEVGETAAKGAQQAAKAGNLLKEMGLG